MAMIPPTMPMFPPIPIRDVTLPHVAIPVIMGYPVDRTRNVPAIDNPPRAVVCPGPVPAVTSRAPPVPVIKEYVEIHSRYEVDSAAGDHYHFRRCRHYNGWRPQVNAYSHIDPGLRLSDPASD
jgi:hypothetical protein